jgi:hypothetical protein
MIVQMEQACNIQHAKVSFFTDTFIGFGSCIISRFGISGGMLGAIISKGCPFKPPAKASLCSYPGSAKEQFLLEDVGDGQNTC